MAPREEPSPSKCCLQRVIAIVIAESQGHGREPYPLHPADTAVIKAASEPEAEVAIRAEDRCRGRFDAVDVTAFFFNRTNDWTSQSSRFILTSEAHLHLRNDSPLGHPAQPLIRAFRPRV